MEKDFEIFQLIKSQDFKKIYQLIKTKKITNLDIRDGNYNYFIQYVVNYNQFDIMNLILEMKDKLSIRIDIIDTDGRTILYNSIKYNYIKIMKLLIEYNKTNIGISILDLKDKLGLTALHYSVIFNNMDAFKLLLENSADPYARSKDGANTFIIALMYKRDDILEHLLRSPQKYRINFTNNNGETLLQVAITYNNINIAKQLIEINSINLNNTSSDYGLTALHQAIVLDNREIYLKLLDKNVKIDQPDFYGNTPLHYIFSEKRLDYVDDMFKNNRSIQYNYTNINGDTPLHILLESNIDINKEIMDMIVMNTDLNIQNNMGITCLMLIINNNMLERFHSILVLKPLNVFIEDNMYKTIVLTDELIDILISSYYNMLKIRKDELLLDWEKYCANNEIEKLKKIADKIDCKQMIKNVIIKEKRSLPMFHKINLNYDNGIFTNFCFYTGSPIDIMFGLILLYNDFNSKGLNVILDYPLTQNTNLEEHYKKIGSHYPYKMDFANIEVIWSYQKIFFPTYFDDMIKSTLKKPNNNYIVIPIGIETATGAHANILFWDIKNKTIERFEPNGSNYPMGMNYNPELLDSIMESRLKEFDPKITYYNPYKFLPSISFQILENLETDKCKKIGDPNGFCGVWCIWWVYQRMLNINKNLDIKEIANYMIQHIKMDSVSFKSVIRNFSKKITDIRDVYLKRVSIDINDWIVGNYTEEILSKLEKDIFKIISK
jgi:ankyrin repeat protein